MTGGREDKPSPLAGEGGARQCRAPGEGGTRPPFLTQPCPGTAPQHDRCRACCCGAFCATGSSLACKFRRQVSIGPYIADFVCYDARLVIEADGGQHNRVAGGQRFGMPGLPRKDFASCGFGTMRFSDNPEGVATIIALALKGEAPLTRPLCGHPLPQGERVTPLGHLRKGRGLKSDEP